MIGEERFGGAGGVVASDYDEFLRMAHFDLLRETQKFFGARLEAHGEADEVGVAGGVGDGGDVGMRVEGGQGGFVAGGEERRGEIADGEVFFVVGTYE
jgi:hypothetical protein